MNVEVHPEEALDRALRGELSGMEQQALDQHLAACSACEAHLALARSAKEACAPQPWGSSPAGAGIPVVKPLVPRLRLVP